jgi:hypothetical protein
VVLIYLRPMNPLLARLNWYWPLVDSIMRTERLDW